MWSFFVFLAFVALAALVGGRFTPGLWYRGLSKPAWTPPGWLFGPVWSAIYLCIAVSGWLVWRRSGGRARTALALWVVQLVLNAAWSWLFFGLHRPDVAFVEIVALWLVIAGYVVAAAPETCWGAGLFVPYGLWVLFAGVLNFAIWRLNRVGG